MDRKTLILMLVVVCGIIASFLCGTYAEKRVIEARRAKVDTLVVESIKYDTIRIVEPLYVTQRVVEYMEIPVTDTIVKNDTTFITLPRQQRKYVTPYYDAWVSGYNPNLDSIKLYQKTKYITKEIPIEKKVFRKWGFGLQGGYGMVIPNNEKPTLGGYVGLGLTYHF